MSSYIVTLEQIKKEMAHILKDAADKIPEVKLRYIYSMYKMRTAK